MGQDIPVLLHLIDRRVTPTRSARRTANQRIDLLAKSCELYAGSAHELTRLTSSPTFDFADVQPITIGMEECRNTLNGRLATYDAKVPVECGTPVIIESDLLSSVNVLATEELKTRLGTFGFALQALVNKGPYYELQGRFLDEQDAPQDHKQIRDRIVNVFSRIAAMK